MLVLATDDDELLRAAGLEQLDAEGYVEPVVAPSRPLHLLAQQLLLSACSTAGSADRPVPALHPARTPHQRRRSRMPPHGGRPA